MPVTRAVPRPPSPAVPLIDADGRINPAWYAFIMQLLALITEMRDEIP